MASHPFLLSQPQKKKNPTKIKHKYEPHLKPTNPKDLKRPPNTQNSIPTPVTRKCMIHLTKTTKPKKRLTF